MYHGAIVCGPGFALGSPSASFSAQEDPMIQRAFVPSLSRGVLRPCAFCIWYPRLDCFLLICIIFLLSAFCANAQSAQQYIYGSTASELAGFSKGANGGITAVTGTPFGDPQFQGGMMAIDGRGQFLFVIDHASSGVWMFQIQATARLREFRVRRFSPPLPATSAPLHHLR
jgi:hypothetical protein